VGKVDVSTNTGLKLGFAITNINKKPVKFLKWATPFEGAFSNMFIVRNADGIRQRYVGADARRKPLHDVNEEDFIELKPGQSERIMVDITDQYEFDGDGAYYIRVGNPEDGHIRYTDMMETRVRVEITGTEKQKALRRKVEAQLLSEKAERVSFIQAKTGVKGMTFKSNCSPSQKANLQKWLVEAKKWLRKAAVCTASSGGYYCTENIKTWFNPTTIAKYASSVQDSLENMLSKWEDSDWDCDPPQCRPNVFAYVYPTQTSQMIQMCPFTFTYKVESEKMQTIIHELSHFDHIGVNEAGGSQKGERDEAYGESKCKALAQDQPIRAMNNADNIGYFVRDVGLDSDPNCVDKSSTQCPGWAKSNYCDRKLTSGESVKNYCMKSCDQCNTPPSSHPPPLPPPSTPRPTPSTSSTRRRRYTAVTRRRRYSPTSPPTPNPTSATRRRRYTWGVTDDSSSEAASDSALHASVGRTSPCIFFVVVASAMALLQSTALAAAH